MSHDDPNAAQKRRLTHALEENGWTIVAREIENLDWWADEQWTIESLWSPSGFRLYLTFLVDPSSGSQRAKGHDVWALTASRRPLTNRVDDAITIRWKQPWGQELPSFVAHLSDLRNDGNRGISS